MREDQDRFVVHAVYRGARPGSDTKPGGGSVKRGECIGATMGAVPLEVTFLGFQGQVLGKPNKRGGN